MELIYLEILSCFILYFYIAYRALHVQSLLKLSIHVHLSPLSITDVQLCIAKTLQKSKLGHTHDCIRTLCE